MKNRDDLCRWRTMMNKEKLKIKLHKFIKICVSFQLPTLKYLKQMTLLFLKISNFSLRTLPVLILHIRWPGEFKNTLVYFSFLFILNIIFYFGFYHVLDNCLFRKVFRLELIFSRITRLFQWSINLAENTLHSKLFPKSL